MFQQTLVVKKFQLQQKASKDFSNLEIFIPGRIFLRDFLYFNFLLLKHHAKNTFNLQ